MLLRKRFLGLSALGLLLMACAPQASKVPTKGPASVPAKAPAASATAAAPVVYAPLPYLSPTPVRTFEKATQVIVPGKQYRAVLKTSKGDITIDLNAAGSPVAVNNFVFLALNRFYDGTRFHRVIDGFMAQGGDPLSADPAKKAAWGTGGPGYEFSYEVKNKLRFNSSGVLGMARSASPDSQGSQFFITLTDADFLSGQYTVFGKVSAGQDALNKLTRTASGNDVPLPGVVADTLQSVTILASK
ncbi:peptidylprolyl isomerase [Deinococcus sp. Arct2-2]|uniref:peptidylprolyl isomerase n=1 Tax=Deinococcus sp. Arct2-2 TaxID=2568653 RepID=UPI0010A586B1|nr:peptidylprolyl isomerase [Deinococcus sp. Arct2-2]THF68205.1 peptidylprolyl isomerase [Deinococcus sp. Arct2-2]